MRRGYGCAIFLTVLIACMGATGCGGGSGSSIPPLKITVTSLPSGVVGSPYSATLTATGGTPSYTWSQVSGGDLPAGLSLGNAGVFSGTPTTAGTFGPYVFKAADSNSLVAQTVPLSIVIATNTLTVTTTSLPSGVVNSSYSVTLAATGGKPPYTWAQSAGGSLPPGIATITSAGVLTGTPTAAGTFGPYVFKVIDSTNQASASTNLFITISAAPAAACKGLGGEGALTASTPYAFLLQGRDGSGRPLDIIGSFTPDGAGNLTSATVDYNGFINGPQQMQVDLAQSSYAFSSTTNQGCLSLVFAASSGDVASARREGKSPRFVHGPALPDPSREAVPAATSSVSSVLFAFGLGGFDGELYHTGRIIENDNTGGGTNASGLIHLQTPSAFSIASLQPNYAFGVDGWTADNTGFLRTVIAGSFANSSGSLSNGVADMNVQGTASGELPPPPPPPPAVPPTPLPAGYGTLNSAVDSTTGRGTGTYNITSPSGVLTFDFAFYILNGSDFLLISTDSPISVGSAPLLSGRALATGASFPAGALNGYYVMALQGIEVGSKKVGNYAAIGTLNATSTGTIPSATLYVNNSGAYTNNPYSGASYTTDAASGRSPLSGFTLNSPVAYPTAPGSDDGIAGFLVGTDPNSSSGELIFQSASAPAYALSDVTGNYAASTNEDVDGLNGASFGVFSFTGSGTFTATQIATGQVAVLTNPGTITVNADGSGTLNGSKMSLVTNGSVIYAIPNSGDPLVYVFLAASTPE
jgi:hypothetical protein